MKEKNQKWIKPIMKIIKTKNTNGGSSTDVENASSHS